MIVSEHAGDNRLALVKYKSHHWLVIRLEDGQVVDRVNVDTSDQAEDVAEEWVLGAANS